MRTRSWRAPPRRTACGVAFGVGNTVTTAAEEEAKMAAAMKARAGGGEQLGALKALNDAMGDAVPGAPAAA